jgi:transcriptional regulator with XRE-family HTH domain
MNSECQRFVRIVLRAGRVVIRPQPIIRRRNASSLFSINPEVNAPSRKMDIISTMKDRASVDINTRIATRVSALRAERGLSLEGLAAKCDVSRSMLSLIERGESSPTAVVLEKIATGLGVMLASLFDDPSAPVNPVSRRQDRTPWKDPQSGYVRWNISPPGFPSPLRIVEVVLPAGARVAYETSVREENVHQQIWIQEGTVELTVGRVSYRLTEDDCLAMKLDAPTTFRNPTRKRARYIVVLATV